MLPGWLSTAVKERHLAPNPHPRLSARVRRPLY
jgi:hypothetical protein